MSCGRRLLAEIVIVCAAAQITLGQTAAPGAFHNSLSGAFVYQVLAGPNHGESYPFLNNAPGYSVGYGFQPRRWFVLEAGFEQIVRPLGSSVCCEYGTNANDQLYLVPFGARYVWDHRSSGLRLTVGGGGAYVNHTVGSPASGSLGFSGWGGQYVASCDVPLTKSGNVRIGATVRYYVASPKPSYDFSPAGYSQRDAFHAFVLGPEVIFSFR